MKEQDIPGIAGIDTRALTKILREKGTMNGMITTNENYNLEEILPKLKEYTDRRCGSQSHLQRKDMSWKEPERK